MEAPDPQRHRFSGAIEDGAEGTHVLRCECGWQTTPGRSAEALGAQWDQHRREHP